MKMKLCTAILLVLYLLAAPAVSLAAEPLDIPDGERTIHTEWKLWNDGIPISIKDGGPYNLGGGKTGTSITISGLSALAVKSNGEVYKYSHKKNTFERMKNAKKEPEKDQIRLVFENPPENRPYLFSLPVQNTFPNVVIAFDGITGSLAEQVHLQVESESGRISVWNDRYQVEYWGDDDAIRAQYDPDGKLIKAEYRLERDDKTYNYVYRRKVIAYGRFEIVPDEIKVYGEEFKTLTWKNGAWQPDENDRPAEEIVGEGFVHDPCRIVGDSISLDIPFDPEDTSWKACPKSENAIHGTLPALTAVPWLPVVVRQEMVDDGTIQLTVDGMYYWGMKEEELCEWTRADKWDWHISGEGEGDRLMTMRMPADVPSTLFKTELKDGTQLKFYYSPDDGELQIVILDGETEYWINNEKENRAEIDFRLEDGRMATADYDLSTGRLIDYSVADREKGIYCYYLCSMTANSEEPVLCNVEGGDGKSYYFDFNRSTWYVMDYETMENTECGTLPEDLAEATAEMRVPVIRD